MKTVDIEDDVWEDLVRNREGFETLSDSIRRRLASKNGTAFSSTSSVGASNTTVPDAVTYILADPAFISARTALQRQLVVLSLVYKKHAVEFERALGLHGRKRQYLGRSAAELEATGNSVGPVQIPGAPFYVISNTENPRKVDIIEGVMDLCGYSAAEIASVTKHFPAGKRA
jgi:negative modulator of initiation of replication